jgi:hypothetical protein
VSVDTPTSLLSGLYTALRKMMTGVIQDLETTTPTPILHISTTHTAEKSGWRLTSENLVRRL